MVAAPSTIEIIDARRSALQSLDPFIRESLAEMAPAWGLASDSSIELTVYDRVYGRTPALGGHWTLFSASLSETYHEVATLSVAVEFDGERPVDLRVSGVLDVAAGGCSRAALREALLECAGPLRQLTPVAPFAALAGARN
jgi:hypothetical protein